MEIKFAKMQGLGNDFVVIDAIHQAINLTPEQLRFLADRHYGVGCDQILLIEKPQNQHCDFHYRIFNADGSEVSQCGNGARCLAKFVRDQGLTDADELRVETNTGQLRLVYQDHDLIQVDMGVPCLFPEQIPFLAEEQAPLYSLNIPGIISGALSSETVQIGAVSLGNPHAVMRVDEVKQTPVATLGPYIESHARFPEGVNVGFMEIVDRRTVKLRVYERGVGETLACGSGACAAVVIGIVNDDLDHEVTVELSGGELFITWWEAMASVTMTGPASLVFMGEIILA